MISTLWNLRSAFWLRTWSILVKVLCALEKYVYSAVLGCTVMCVCIEPCTYVRGKGVKCVNWIVHTTYIPLDWNLPSPQEKNGALCWARVFPFFFFSGLQTHAFLLPSAFLGFQKQISLKKMLFSLSYYSQQRISLKQPCSPFSEAELSTCNLNFFFPDSESKDIISDMKYFQWKHPTGEKVCATGREWRWWQWKQSPSTSCVPSTVLSVFHSLSHLILTITLPGNVTNIISSNLPKR